MTPRRRSWVDVLFDAVDRVPGPRLLHLVGLMAASAGAAALLRLLDGSTGAGVTSPVTILFAATVPLPWAAAHLLARAARVALATYRPALGELETQYGHLERGLTRMPGWVALLALVLGVGVWAFGQFSNPTGWGVRAETSTLTDAVTYALGAVFNVGFVVFAFRAIQQTRLITVIHRRSTGVDIWAPAASRAFSRLTLAIALILVVPYAVYDLLAIWVDGFVAEIDLAILAAAFIVAIAVFFLPLMGMHRQLEEKRNAALLESNRAFASAGRRLHAAVAGDLAETDALNAAMQALSVEHARLRATSTWPWSGETLGSLAASIGAPVVLFLITALLSRLLGL